MATEVLAPPLGTNVDTITILEWHAAEGDQVKSGQVLFTVETDKATLDVEAPATGILSAITAVVGNEVPVLSRIALILADGEQPTAAPAPTAPAQAQPPAPQPVAAQQAYVPSAPGRNFASPRARRLAGERGVDWTLLAGTGPEGAVVERDVLQAIEAAHRSRPTPLARRVAEETGVDLAGVAGTGPGGRIRRDDVARVAQARPTAAEDVVIPLAGPRAIIAKRMSASSRESATLTLTAEVDATNLVALRKDLADEGLKVSYNDLLMLFCARALREHPEVNASIGEDRIIRHGRISIGLAVDAGRGLLVPVVRDVDQLDLAGIAAAGTELVAKAREGKVTPDDLTGGTFTITNLGMFGIDAFTPIVNLPECAILGVGRIKKRPAVVGDAIVPRDIMWLSLSFDHRLIDGGPAARFLQRITALCEAPGRSLAW